MLTQSANCCFMHATNAHAHIEHCEPSTVKRAVDRAVTRAVTRAVFRNFLTATLAPSPYQLPALLRATSGQCANVLPQSDLTIALRASRGLLSRVNGAHPGRDVHSRLRGESDGAHSTRQLCYLVATISGTSSTLFPYTTLFRSDRKSVV